MLAYNIIKNLKKFFFIKNKIQCLDIDNIIIFTWKERKRQETIYQS